jgi:cobalamin-dependent methionine synthase I
VAIQGLTIIGESINDSVPSTKKLFDAGDFDGILELARSQDAGGAAWIDVNVGSRPPEFMADLVRRIQQVTSKPLSIDTPDVDLARAGLAAYDPAKAGGQRPILNSVSALRVEMFDLYRVRPFLPILLVSEQEVEGRRAACRTAEETHEAARTLVARFQRSCPGATNEDCILDPGIIPLGGDTEDNLHRLIGALRRMRDDADLAGTHRSVGLSNFTVMLPSKRADGSPVKGPLESAFLTIALPLGLDMIIGSVRRRYELLPPGHPALVCLEECLKRSGIEVLMRVRDYYS